MSQKRITPNIAQNTKKRNDYLCTNNSRDENDLIP